MTTGVGNTSIERFPRFTAAQDAVRRSTATAAAAAAAAIAANATAATTAVANATTAVAAGASGRAATARAAAGAVHASAANDAIDLTSTHPRDLMSMIRHRTTLQVPRLSSL